MQQRRMRLYAEKHECTEILTETLGDSPKKKSFADAELRENPVQNIFRCRFSDDVAEGIKANV